MIKFLQLPNNAIVLFDRNQKSKLEGRKLCDLEGSAGKAPSLSCTPQRPPRTTTRLRTPPPRDLAPRSPKPPQVPSPHPPFLYRNATQPWRNAIQWNSVKTPAIKLERVLEEFRGNPSRGDEFCSLLYASQFRRQAWIGDDDDDDEERVRHATSPWMDECIRAIGWMIDQHSSSPRRWHTSRPTGKSLRPYRSFKCIGTRFHLHAIVTSASNNV